MVVDIDKDIIRDKALQLRFHRTNGDDTIRKGVGDVPPEASIMP